MNPFQHRSIVISSTALFVLLWSSGAIFAKWGLEHSSTLALLILRFTVALAALLLFGSFRGQMLPTLGSRFRVAITGVLLTGGYSAFYFLALEQGVTPGILATILGTQPILTLLFYERRFDISRLVGLTVALFGLMLIVLRSVELERVSSTGTWFALCALFCATAGAILQKGIKQSPLQVLPLQYSSSLLLYLLISPSMPLRVDFDTAFLLSLLWLGLVISVVAQLLLYQMIRSGNLVNVFSLFYLVPIVTAAMDFIVFDHRLSPSSIAGMALIMVGLMLVFHKTKSSA